MDHNDQLGQSEISIREILEAIFRGKIIVAVITIIAVVFSMVYSLFFMQTVLRC